jgi:hypothetical protein
LECLDDREIDDLILGRIPGDDAQRCLAHLLWCGQCQARVEEEREFAIAIRAAANILEKETLATRNGAAVAGWGQRLAEWLGAPFSTRWVVVAASACVMLALGIYAPLRYAGPGAAEVLLHSERGVATPATVEASVSGHLRLLIDVTDVVPSASYSAILVDADGRELEKQTVAPSGGIVSLPVGRSLAPARYWIRLSTPDGPLLREYALLVR